MAYDLAMQKAWDGLDRLKPKEDLSVRFLSDEYAVDLKNRKVTSLSCNAPAKDFLSILLLHYLSARLKGLPEVSGEWLNFKELSGIEGYGSSFRKRSIEPLIRKYGANPEGILEVLDRLPAKRVNQGDLGIVLEAFEGLPAMITLWRADQEFGPDVNMLFDRSITDIFCTEDIVVLAGLIASEL